MGKKVIALLLLIILIGFFLRFYKIDTDPPSLNWDEVSIGYNAYSILKTGKDEWGQFLPLHFKSYGEYKLPVQIYASIPGIAIFGLNEFGVRVTPLIYGTLTILIIFLLARSLFDNDYIALLSALLVATSPWHIQLTRASFESSLALFWVVLGIWFFSKGLKDSKWFIYCVIPFTISVYTYNSERIFIPLFLLSLFIIYHKILLQTKKKLLLAITLFFILMVPLIPFVLSGEGSARYKLVSVTDDPGLILRINENRGNSNLPFFFPRLIHNKITYVSLSIGEHYLAHFTPDFLFLNGAPHKQHHVQGMGELYLFQAPFLFLGLYLLLRKKQKFKWLIISWLLLSYIPVSVTNDSIPHALRTLIAMPTYQLISAFGLYNFVSYLMQRRKAFGAMAVILTFVIAFINLQSYLYNYFTIYPINYSRDWQYGNKQMVEYIKEHYGEYDLIVYTRADGEPHMFTLFYLNYDPEKYQNNPNLVRFETYDWIRVLKFDKFYFPDLGDDGTKFKDIITQNLGKKILFIGKPNDFPVNIPRLETIDFLNGNRAFDIVETK